MVAEIPEASREGGSEINKKKTKCMSSKGLTKHEIIVLQNTEIEEVGQMIAFDKRIEK